MRLNKNVLIALVILIVLGIGGFIFMNRNSQPTTETGLEDSLTPSTTDTTTETMDSQMASDSAALGAVKEFNVSNQGTAFTIKEMKVNKGDTVRVTLKVAGGTHDWVLDDFDAKTKVLKTGEEETIEFIADQAGTFEYYCSVPGHKEAGMVGKLIVQ